MADIGDALAASIRAERSRKSWRQADLAERLGVAQRTVSDMEAGRELTFREVLHLCEVFGVPLSRLLAEADLADRTALGL